MADIYFGLLENLFFINKIKITLQSDFLFILGYVIHVDTCVQTSSQVLHLKRFKSRLIVIKILENINITNKITIFNIS